MFAEAGSDMLPESLDVLLHVLEAERPPSSAAETK